MYWRAFEINVVEKTHNLQTQQDYPFKKIFKQLYKDINIFLHLQGQQFNKRKTHAKNSLVLLTSSKRIILGAIFMYLKASA